MAVSTDSPASPAHDTPPLWSRFKARLRASSKSKSTTNPQFDTRPPLLPSLLPLVRDEHAPNLPFQGWTTVTFPPPSPALPTPHPLQRASEELFEASRAFFALPFSEKEVWKTKLGSEEGWSRIEGEKEFITLRTVEGTPEVLKAAARAYWNAAGGLLDQSLGRIGESLGLQGAAAEEGGLRRYVGPCKKFQERDGEKTATMLRLFRYEGDERKVVAEPHSDLGLLSLVIGDTPGLEVWDIHTQCFFPVEKTYDRPAASLLVGRQLERLSNYRYRAGGHQVKAYGRTEAQASTSPSRQPLPNYRYSIVFVLRAHESVIVDTDMLTTQITGKFEKPIKEVTAGRFYEQIRNAHFNININVEEREEQRKRVAAKKAAEGVNGSG
ncbi:uncharacterized protein BDZ99DRAFT_509496 [Mytilinidion resinicola]|uniref:Clavaminate synthase-like protein n=1 Tax=Mytilinidion resinicola TaxID=574789 RepID=A0A6A6YMM6_9PEZI|nr:uncharacterized protein BDZ99DRAFT_509496 [Mytilinidion resinicola]KAF2809244.1 hypothetical protein BDZ99DRAFT_509496 [Mytilinidion resinicola]